MDENDDRNVRARHTSPRLRALALFAVLVVASIACPAIVATINRDRHAALSARRSRELQAKSDARDLPDLTDGLEGALARRFCGEDEILYNPPEGFTDSRAVGGVRLGARFFSRRGAMPVARDKNWRVAQLQDGNAKIAEWMAFREYLTTPAASRDAEELGISSRLLDGAASRLRMVTYDFRCGNVTGKTVSKWKTVGE